MSILTSSPTITREPVVVTIPVSDRNSNPSNSSCSCYDDSGKLNTGVKYLLFPFWAIWITVTSVACCPLLLCTAGGMCGRDSGGNPTYPECLAATQCCEVMCCKCTVGY